MFTVLSYIFRVSTSHFDFLRPGRRFLAAPILSGLQCRCSRCDPHKFALQTGSKRPGRREFLSSSERTFLYAEVTRNCGAPQLHQVFFFTCKIGARIAQADSRQLRMKVDWTTKSVCESQDEHHILWAGGSWSSMVRKFAGLHPVSDFRKDDGRRKRRSVVYDHLSRTNSCRETYRQFSNLWRQLHKHLEQIILHALPDLSTESPEKTWKTKWRSKNTKNISALGILWNIFYIFHDIKEIVVVRTSRRIFTLARSSWGARVMRSDVSRSAKQSIWF
jgi:hypothetical protein